MIRILLLIFLPTLCLCELKYSFKSDQRAYSHFSHRTPYLFTSSNQSIKHPAGCTPLYLWSYLRHGTRFPSKENVVKRKLLEKLKDEIYENFENGRGELNERNAERIKKWKIVKELEDSDIRGQITVQGALDMEILAKILRNSFPTLLADKLTDKYEIRTSSINRTWESALAFINAMTDNAFHSLYEIRTLEINDELVALHRHCPNYQNEQKKDLLDRETFLFKNSWLMNDTLITISNRLGFNETLPYDLVEAMYESCAFESAWITDKKAPFCAVFLKQDLEVFEYKEDLDFYWKKGYGHPHIRRLGCPLVRDMLMILNDAAKNTNRTYTATLNFGHIEMLIAIVTKLGLFLDHNPIRSWNHQAEEVKNREWKLSSIGSFASNIQAALYSCDKENGTEHNVVIYYNGKEVVVPRCGESPCPLEKFKFEFDNVFDESFCSSMFCYSKY